MVSRMIENLAIIYNTRVVMGDVYKDKTLTGFPTAG